MWPTNNQGNYYQNKFTNFPIEDENKSSQNIKDVFFTQFTNQNFPNSSNTTPLNNHDYWSISNRTTSFDDFDKSEDLSNFEFDFDCEFDDHSLQFSDDENKKKENVIESSKAIDVLSKNLENSIPYINNQVDHSYLDIYWNFGNYDQNLDNMPNSNIISNYINHSNQNDYISTDLSNVNDSSFVKNDDNQKKEKMIESSKKIDALSKNEEYSLTKISVEKPSLLSKKRRLSNSHTEVISKRSRKTKVQYDTNTFANAVGCNARYLATLLKANRLCKVVFASQGVKIDIIVTRKSKALNSPYLISINDDDLNIVKEHFHRRPKKRTAFLKEREKLANKMNLQPEEFLSIPEFASKENLNENTFRTAINRSKEKCQKKYNIATYKKGFYCFIRKLS